MLIKLNSLYRVEIPDKINRKKFIFYGNNGFLSLNIIKTNIFEVEYILDNVSYPNLIDEACKIMCSGLYSNSPKEIGNFDGKSVEFFEEDLYYTITLNGHKILINKNNSNISIFYKNKLIHGGEIGTSDTVLPYYPLRVQFDENQSTFKGTFNFHLDIDDHFFGFGEKSGLLDKRNRILKMNNKDALGYNAQFSDPLYKSIPFFIKYNKREKFVVGIFIANPSIEEVNLGVESNYYYKVKLNNGPFRYYVITGDNYKDIIEYYMSITGKPYLPPLYTFGFFGSSMHYSEPDNAESKILDFFNNVEKHDIPCEGIYLSSGYTKSREGKRFPLIWNRQKFKNPEKFFKNLKSKGYKTCCNVKPGFLLSHPFYKELSERGFFIKSKSGIDYKEYYWGGYASLFNFLNKKAREWWKNKIRENFIKTGIAGIWNDNNEYEIEDESLEYYHVRSILPVMMAKSSYEIFKHAFPDKRPWIISRSGYAGIQKYARTWTGDNYSDFKTIYFNTLMGLNLGLSGIPFYGHDIGGFFGPLPSRELLIRWCQAGVFQPRFVLHSWNNNNIPTEPWTYSDSVEIIKNLINLHYYFIPYIYNEAIKASKTGNPLQRMLCLEFPYDDNIALNDPNYLFGDFILVPTVITSNTNRVNVYLPKNTYWYDPQSKKLYKGGKQIRMKYGLNDFRYLVKAGSIIPVAPELKTLETAIFQKLSFNLFPFDSVEYHYIEDDGSTELLTGNYNKIILSLDKLKEKGGKYHYQFTFEVTEKLKMEIKQPPDRSIHFKIPRGFQFKKETLKLAGDKNSIFSVRLTGTNLTIHTRYLPEHLSIELVGNYTTVV